MAGSSRQQFIWCDVPHVLRASQVALVVENQPANAGDKRDLGSIPESGRSPGGGHGNPLQFSCLENPHGQRSLVGYSPWGRKESDRSEVTWHVHMPCMLKAGLRAATRWFKALDEFSRTGLNALTWELATELTRPLPGNSNSAMATTTTGPTHRTHIQVTQAADSLKQWEDRRGFQPARKHFFQVCWLAQRLL